MEYQGTPMIDLVVAAALAFQDADVQPPADDPCAENRPEGRSPDVMDCRLKVGMKKKDVRKALGGNPTREMPGRDGDRIRFYVFKQDDGSKVLVSVVYDRKGTVKFWRTYIDRSE